LRENLDPRRQYSDSEIKIVIDKLDLENENAFKQKGMHSLISYLGDNLSQGEK